jgi:transcriptional regulator with XRE-family HTH domain
VARQFSDEQRIKWEILRSHLRKERLRKSLSYAQLGERMGVGHDMVRWLENNDRSTPNVATLMDWLAALGMEIAFVNKSSFDTMMDNYMENPR